MTDKPPRKMRYPSGQIHDEDRKWCPECGCVPVEPEPEKHEAVECTKRDCPQHKKLWDAWAKISTDGLQPSRSVQRRVAVQKGESMPTFEPQEPGMEQQACPTCKAKPHNANGDCCVCRAITEAELQRVAELIAFDLHEFNATKFSNSQKIIYGIVLQSLRTLEKKA